MSTETLLDYVLSELEQRKGDWPTIATDNDVGYSWLSKLAQGKIDEPGIKKIEKLAGYFRADRRFHSPCRTA